MLSIDTYKEILETMKQEYLDAKTIVKLIENYKKEYNNDVDDTEFLDFEIRQKEKCISLATKVEEVEKYVLVLEGIAIEQEELENKIKSIVYSSYVSNETLNNAYKNLSQLVTIVKNLEQYINIYV